MDWLKKMNAAISYIEANIKNSIDYNEVARAASCPGYHFQKMFAFITDISLAQYIRRRRLTLAAFDLQQSDKSIIEIAQDYGYESHAAFTRAFSELHGMSPAASRKPGTKLKAYPPMSFNISLTGGTEMDYRIENLPPFSAVGFKYRVNTEKAFSVVPTIWQEASRNGIGAKLLKLMEATSTPLLNGILGISSEGNWDNNADFAYYIAVPYNKPTPLDMEKLDFPECQWVVFEAATLHDISKAWKRLYTEWIPTSNYSLANLPAIECCYPPGHNPQNELWIPIIK